MSHQTSDRGALAAPRRRRHGAAGAARPPSRKRLAPALAFDKHRRRLRLARDHRRCSRSGCRTRSRTLATAKQILNTNAITGLAALAILIPLAARVFDLSFAFVMTLTGVVVANARRRTACRSCPAIALGARGRRRRSA